VFGLLSLYLFVRYLRVGGGHLLPGSAVLYALAITAKEIYVPLVLLLPVVGIVYLMMLGCYAVLARSWLLLALLSAALVLIPLVPLESSPGISSIWWWKLSNHPAARRR